MLPADKPVSASTIRRLAIAAQGYASRPLNAKGEQIVECVRKLSCVQLDSIATVERSHLLVLGSRVGKVAPGAVSELLRTGRLFEYWAHEACLLDSRDYPLWRRRMKERRVHHWWGEVIGSDRKLAKQVLDAIRERGPLGSRHFEGRGGGGMWNLKPAKRMLDALWTAGELMVCGRQGFQRLYDLPERVLPEAILQAPPPGEAEVLNTLIVRAIRARGALTASGVVNHYKMMGGASQLKAPLAALVREQILQCVQIDDGGAPIYIDAATSLENVATAENAVLLSPFENLLWDRSFNRRFLQFDHLIEVYKKQEQRQFGYYVLPFLYNDKIVGRADLKSDRDANILRVKAFHLEARIKKSSALEEAFHRALARLARNLSLGTNLQTQRR